MKVYLVAYGCEPNQGGEHEVGWKIAKNLKSKCDLTVITRKSNEMKIENEKDSYSFFFGFKCFEFCTNSNRNEHRIL